MKRPRREDHWRVGLQMVRCWSRSDIAPKGSGRERTGVSGGQGATSRTVKNSSRHARRCMFIRPVATGGVESERVGSSGAGCVVACGGFGGDPRAGWRSSCDLHPGGCVDPSVDGVAACPCWSAAVVVWWVLAEGETASPADGAGMDVRELADGGRACVKRAGVVARFHALIGARPQGRGGSNRYGG